MLTLLASLALASTGPKPPQAPPTPFPPHETKAQKAARLGWWNKSRFGMFIHWGLYAVPAGAWNGQTNYAEWIREEAHIPVKTYEKFVPQFNPVKFDAKKWAKMAHDAGMQYMVITSKHHDGFNMFDSKYTDFKVTNSAWHHDPMKDLSKAVRGEGMKFCFYHSIMDWHYPDYLPRRSWEVKDRPADGADYKKFVQYLRNDVQQLLTDYGPIGVMWFDGQWESTWKQPLGTELYALCRKVQPNVIVNNRVGPDGSGVGDYSTPEQTIPATGLPGVDWETCMTMNDHWGYNKADLHYKTVKALVRDLADIASKGGNFLLNIGPEADGTFPPLAIDRLKGIGAWMRINHDAIYDTTASVFDSLPFGRCTVREGSKRTQLFLHVFDWPADGKLVVPGIGNQVLRARLLGGSTLTVQRTGTSITISVPKAQPNSIDTVVELDVAGKPTVFKTPVIDLTAPGFVGSIDVPIKVPANLQVRYTLHGSAVTGDSPLYTAPIHIDQPSAITAVGFYNGKPVTAAAKLTLNALDVWPALDTAGNEPGLDVQEFHGDYNVVADFINGTADRSLTAKRISLDPSWTTPPEHIGRIYSGRIDVPASSLYKFILTSDDGAQLWIDGKLVADDDGTHAPKDAIGFAPLAKGSHTIKVAWFNKNRSRRPKPKMGHRNRLPSANQR